MGAKKRGLTKIFSNPNFLEITVCKISVVFGEVYKGPSDVLQMAKFLHAVMSGRLEQNVFGFGKYFRLKNFNYLESIPASGRTHNRSEKY